MSNYPDGMKESDIPGNSRDDEMFSRRYEREKRLILEDPTEIDEWIRDDPVWIIDLYIDYKHSPGYAGVKFLKKIDDYIDKLATKRAQDRDGG